MKQGVIHLKNLLNSTYAKATGAALMVLTTLAVASPSFAATYTTTQAQSDATGYAGTVFSALGPMVIAIASAVIGIALLVWGVRTVLRKLHGVHV